MKQAWGLTPKQKLFCEAYIANLSVSEAGKAAGYSPKAASTVLNSANVQAYISFLQQEDEPLSNVNAQAIIRELSRIAFSDIGDVLDFDEHGVSLKRSREMSLNARRCIKAVSSHTVDHADGGSSTTTKITLYDKQKALIDLGKHLGLFNDFNQAISCLEKYGLKLFLNSKGEWVVNDENRSSTTQSIDSLQQKLKKMMEED